MSNKKVDITDIQMGESDDPTAEVDPRRERLHEITQETRFAIIRSILMHPEQLPSLEEIDFINQNRSKTTLREHIENLIDMDIVERVELPQEQVKRDNPKVFFGLTSEGRKLLDEFGLLELEDNLQYLYSNTEKPEAIQRYEQAPRPDQDSDNQGSKRHVSQ